MSAMRRLAELLRDMLAAGVIRDYALFGATAQMRYTEAVSTMDADVLVALPSRSTLDILRPIYEYCASRGYRPEGEAIRVGDWPVQFIPAYDALTEEAMREAESADVDGVPIKVVRADHLGVIALSTGRPKDLVRILALLESGSVSREALGRLADRHGLSVPWRKFLERFLEA